jgi:hypothetical protein
MTVPAEPRRSILPTDAACFCSGRWGRRRVRTSECVLVIRAEDVYTALLRDAEAPLRPGAAGVVSCLAATGHGYEADWVIRQNAVWRHGRVFVVCPQCHRQRTRLYVPRHDSPLACRSCWGLTYASRTLQNYKNSLFGRGRLAQLLGTTQREWALMTTLEARKERARRAVERNHERRAILRTTKPMGP